MLTADHALVEIGRDGAVHIFAAPAAGGTPGETKAWLDQLTTVELRAENATKVTCE